MRTEEIKEIKKMKIISIKKEIERLKNNNYNTNNNNNNNYNRFKFTGTEASNFENNTNTINNYYSNNTINNNNSIININSSSHNNNFNLNPYEIKSLKKSNSMNFNLNNDNKNDNEDNNNNNFNTWYNEKEKWNNKKIKKLQSLKAQKTKEKFSMDFKESTFTPNLIKINKKFLSNKINNNNNNNTIGCYSNKKNEKEKSPSTIFEKLYSLNSAKKEKIQILEQKYKPNFKPIINKINFFNESSNLGIGFCEKNMKIKSFCIEDKDEDFLNFESDLKNRKIKSINSMNNINNDNNNNLFFKNKEQKRKYYSRLSKGFSPNKDLVIMDEIRFIDRE
jgi:hypothetical protein